MSAIGQGKRRKELPISDGQISPDLEVGNEKPKASGSHVSSSIKKIEFQRFLICPDSKFGPTKVAITKLFSSLTSDYLDRLAGLPNRMQ